MSNYLDHIQARSMQLQYYVLHDAQGENSPLILKEHSEGSGGLVDLAIIAPGNFTVQLVQPKYDGANDYLTVSQHQITFPASVITNALLARLVCVEWQGRRFKLELTSAPLSLDQRWQFLATPMENA